MKFETINSIDNQIKKPKNSLGINKFKLNIKNVNSTIIREIKTKNKNKITIEKYTI